MATLTPKQVLKRSVETTSVRGVARALKEPQKCLKCFWFTAIMMLFLMCLYTLVMLFQHYLSCPTAAEITETEIQNDQGVLSEFQICNRNPISSYKSVAGVQKYDQYKQSIQNKFEGRMSDAALSHMVSHEGYFQNIGATNAQKFGHSYSDLVLKCEVTGLSGLHEYGIGPCNTIYDVNLLVHHKYFNCYTFKLNNASVQVASISIILHIDKKLQELSLEASNEDFDSGSGLVFVMRKSPELSNYWSDEVILPGGQYTKMSATTVLRQRQLPPYGDCKRYLPRYQGIY